jgi:hypothetical protein
MRIINAQFLGEKGAVEFLIVGIGVMVLGFRKGGIVDTAWLHRGRHIGRYIPCFCWCLDFKRSANLHSHLICVLYHARQA